MRVLRALRRHRRSQRDAGFSLVELIIAMMIIAIALLALVALQIRAAISVTESRKVQQATAFANQAMEQMHSIPWNTLSRGLYSGFAAAAGPDSLVHLGNLLTVDSSTTRTLIIAAAPNDQTPSAGNPSTIPPVPPNVAEPLFDKYGSNKQTLHDPSITGVDFTVKAYVVVPTGAPTGIVGMVVVVEWPGRYGVERTVLQSEAYRGADSPCGNANTQPFLAACQSYFDSTASSGNVTVAISAYNVDASGNVVSLPLMDPAPGQEYTLSMRTASATAHLRSQQVTYVDGSLEYGGNTTYGSDPSQPPMAVNGYGIPQTLRATDDVTNQDGILANPSPPPPYTLGVAGGAEGDVSHGGSPVTLQTRSDYGRDGTVTAATTTSSCTLVGIPAGQPCAMSSIVNDNSGPLTGSGYLRMQVNGTRFDLSRRLSDAAPTLGNTDSAWVARLAPPQGGTGGVCTTLTGSGCVAAGATRTNAVLSIGKNIDGNGWNGDAVDGMVQILGDGTPGCTYYTDSVSVQLGTNQTTNSPTASRCGQVRYWNGPVLGYTLVPITIAAGGPYTTPTVTWSDGTYTITGTSEIQVVAVSVPPAPSSVQTCVTPACTVSVSAGGIVIKSTYDIQWSGHEHVLSVSTTVTGSAASASYKAAPS